MSNFKILGPQKAIGLRDSEYEKNIVLKLYYCIQLEVQFFTKKFDHDFINFNLISLVVLEREKKMIDRWTRFKLQDIFCCSKILRFGTKKDFKTHVKKTVFPQTMQIPNYT